MVILGFSIYRIRKYSKQITSKEIFINECLMISHLLSFAFLTILETVTLSLSCVITNRGLVFIYENLNILYANLILYDILPLPYALVYITMCIMFLKHSKSLSKRLLKTQTESGLLERTGAYFSAGGSWILSKSRRRPRTKPFSDMTSYRRS